MLNRRDFIKNTTALALAGSLPLQEVFAQTTMKNNIGIQLFSLPKLLDQDFAKGIEMLAKMGYKEVELFGPFPFSKQSAHDRWNAVTPALGFKGSGYFGKNINEIKAS